MDAVDAMPILGLSTAVSTRADSRAEFDPHVVVSVLDGRIDMLLRGRVVSPVPLDAVAIVHEGAVLCRATFGQAGQDGSAPLPGDPGRRQYALALILPHSLAAMPPDEAPALVPLVVRLWPRGRMPIDQAATLTLSRAAPGKPLQAALDAPTSSLDGYADVPPATVLQVEHAAIGGDGLVTLRGWAVAIEPIVTVQAFLGPERLGAARIGLPREALAAAFPAHANAGRAGFALSARLPAHGPGPAPILVQAIAKGGFVTETLIHVDTAGPAPAHAQAFRLTCDEAMLSPEGDVSVIGWCVAERGLVKIEIEVEGTVVGLAQVGRPRPDVKQAHPALVGAEAAGFAFSARLQGTSWPGLQIGIVATDRDGNTRALAQPLQRAEPPAAVPGPPAKAPEPRIKLHLDTPATDAGVARDPVTGHLTIEGWAVAEPPVQGIDVLLDGERLGSAYHGLARQDVAAAMPEWPGALRSGFAFHCPPRALRNGRHEVTLHVLTEAGSTRETFAIDVAKSADNDAAGGIRRRITRVEADLYAAALAGGTATFDVIVRGGGALERTVSSLRTQVLGQHRLWQAGDAAGDDAAGDDPILLVRAGDDLGCDAFAELALALRPGIDMAYADDVRVTGPEGEREPFFKPDFSPELLLATDYIGSVWCVRPAVLAAAGLTMAELAGLTNHDALLRCAEHARGIAHVPALLHRADAAEPPDPEAVARAAARRGLPGAVVPGPAPGTFRLVPPPGTARERVSVIIPTCGAHGHIRACIRTLRDHTAPGAIDIVAIDNIRAPDPGSPLADTKAWLAGAADRVVEIDEAFNWSRFNNVAVAASTGDMLLFLNDDVEATRDGWLDAMLELARRPGIGAVGAQLLYPDGKVQHAGMFLGRLGQGRHAFRFLDGDDPGAFGLALTQRNVTSVTGACMMVRSDVFQALGGFDEAHDVVNNDLDFCLRLAEAGHRVVFTPHASLIHHELASRAAMTDDYDTSRFSARWHACFAAGDPFHPPGLSKHHDDFRPEEEPVRQVFAGHPLFGRDEIRRILAVKVDHIGDFITALPALRRLKRAFPGARISVLTGKAARAFLHLEDSIDELIEFEWFHERSSDGRRDLDDAAWTALRDRLAPYGFDLAIDLRKHLDTRELLRWTGARYLAGFDHLGQFPFLDISLEWEGDRGLHAKRYHITDDLLHLVDAVATAADADRAGLSRPLLAAAALPALSDKVERLFRRPVACIHAGAGNALKQWPAPYFATLVTMLLDRGLNVVFVGGPDEKTVTRDIMAQAAALGASARRVGSVVGQVRLGDLPALLTRCALFIGNDSGPKHIAAAAGVPTVGIHSGTVDPNEWAPVGPRAVAVHRHISCSPCYILSPDRCPRGLACLTGIDPATVMRACDRLLAAA